MLKFYEAGCPQNKTIVLIHGWGCPWQIWKPYIDQLKQEYNLIVPSLEGYNDDGKYGKGIEHNAIEILRYLKERFSKVHAVIGISYGANVTLKMVALQEIAIAHAIADACYLPKHPNNKEAASMRCWAGIYRIAKPFRKLLIKANAKAWGIENATKMIDKILSLPIKTLQDEAYSYFNFSLPENTQDIKMDLHLWYGEKEIEKIQNSAYVKQRFPCATIRIFPGCNHGDLVMAHPDEYLMQIHKVIEQSKTSTHNV